MIEPTRLTRRSASARCSLRWLSFQQGYGCAPVEFVCSDGSYVELVQAQRLPKLSFVKRDVPRCPRPFLESKRSTAPGLNQCRPRDRLPTRAGFSPRAACHRRPPMTLWHASSPPSRRPFVFTNSSFFLHVTACFKISLYSPEYRSANTTRMTSNAYSAWLYGTTFHHLTMRTYDKWPNHLVVGLVYDSYSMPTIIISPCSGHCCEALPPLAG